MDYPLMQRLRAPRHVARDFVSGAALFACVLAAMLCLDRSKAAGARGDGPRAAPASVPAASAHAGPATRTAAAAAVQR